ncbi:spermidine coumaroyl-CoA acyltransferase-like [Arachis stenosperma]|uniref:spermidine coumaroyl-CoA acyltransferase-like n=1 Tax=Arachis stenosperma TaxID=217475 RepID=UPI0025ACD0F9|nr:spermidine coumaroyl-CoA acyltransferase-like [Arachis stenosperma]
MAHQINIASFKIENKDVEYVKPSKHTPSTTLSLSTIDNRPEFLPLSQVIRVYQLQNNNTTKKNCYSKNDPAIVIKEALSKALVYYYPLAGKLVKHHSNNGKVTINCNEDGVPFVEAIANCDLSSLNYLDLSDIGIAKNFVYDPPFHQDENGNQLIYPMVVKVTKFQCGGFTLGLGEPHTIADGAGSIKIFQAIAEFATGKSEPSVKPVWERERLNGSITKTPLLSPMDGASAAGSPYLPSKTLVHECFKVDSESIKRLKFNLAKEIVDNNVPITNEELSFTNFESLAAYVWRARTRALKLNYDGKTMLKFAVGIRRHIDPPLPEGYYGNTIVDADVVLAVKEVNERPLSQVVKAIRELKKVAFTKEFIKKSIDTLETRVEEFDFDGNGSCMALAEWKHLGFLRNMDFGWKEPVNVIPAPCNMFGEVSICIFFPPCDMDTSMSGGVKIYVSLPIDAMPKFREEMKALAITIS